jgi:hypothetical protein
MTRSCVINVRPGSCDSYVARIVSLGIIASSTSSPESAAQRVALKYALGLKDVCSLVFEDHGITLKPVTRYTYIAEWQEPDPAPPPAPRNTLPFPTPQPTP